MQDNDNDEEEITLLKFMNDLGVFLFKIMIWVVAFLWLASFLQN
jgi:hypothetical protein